MKAYIAIRAEPKEIRPLVQSLAKFPEIREVAAVAGEYDIMAVTKGGTSITNCGDLLINRILKLNGVKETRTFVSLSEKALH
ncbi:MAG TPA: Lrp/AsnC ligand binding domain-containing protein [Candidatus Subteraquimicrobiales bacterium]